MNQSGFQQSYNPQVNNQSSTLKDRMLNSFENGNALYSNKEISPLARLFGGESGKLSELDRIKNFTDRFMKRSKDLYDPYKNTGQKAGNQANTLADLFKNMNTPEAGNLSNDLINQIREQYNQGNIPKTAEMNMPTGPDYGAARKSSLYQQMQNQTGSNVRNNAALQGGSVRGGNTNLGLAQGARQNLVNSANQLYKNDMKEYQGAFNQNQLRNQALSNQFNNNLNLQKLVNQNQQGNFKNQMNQYNIGQQNLQQYLGQLGTNAASGFNQLGKFMNLNQQTTNSQIGSLNGMVNAKASANAAEAQKKAGDISGFTGFVKGLFSDPRLKENMCKIGSTTKNGFDIYTWNWKDKAYDLGKKYGFNLIGWDIGISADDIEKTHPHLVSYVDGYKTVNYGGI